MSFVFLLLRGRKSLALLCFRLQNYTCVSVRHAQAVQPALLGTSGHPAPTFVLLLAQGQELSKARGRTEVAGKINT